MSDNFTQAYIDKRVAYERAIASAEGRNEGIAEAREELAAHVESLRKPPGMNDRTFGYNEAVHDLLAHLRQSDGKEPSV